MVSVEASAMGPGAQEDTGAVFTMLAQTQGHTHLRDAPSESAGFVMIGLVIILATVAVVLYILRRRAADSRPCPYCNVFIPSGSTECPVCARRLQENGRMGL